MGKQTQKSQSSKQVVIEEIKPVPNGDDPNDSEKQEKPLTSPEKKTGVLSENPVDASAPMAVTSQITTANTPQQAVNTSYSNDANVNNESDLSFHEDSQSSSQQSWPWSSLFPGLRNFLDTFPWGR